MHHTLRAIAIVSLLVLPVTLIAESIMPRLFSPKRTGDSYWFEDTRTASNSSTTTQNGEIVDKQNSAFTSLLEANATVITNNATGKAVAERFEIIRFIVNDSKGKDRELLAPGTIFFGRLNLGEKEFTTADNIPLPDDATYYLGQVIALRDNSITDQDIFGPSGPVAIGDEWPVNAKLATEDFNFDMSIQTDPKYIEGTAKLIDIPLIDGVPYAHIVSDMVIERVKLPQQQSMTVTKGDLVFRSETWLPQEGPVYPYEQRMDMSVDFIVEPTTQNQFARRRIMASSTVKAVIKSKPLPRDESVTELDRTLGIRR